MDVEITRDTLLALAAMGWADGKLEPVEAESIRAAARQLMLPAEHLAAVEHALKQPVHIGDVETVRMNRMARLFTYTAATWIAFINGQLAPEERFALDLLGDRLGLSKQSRDRAEELARSMAERLAGDAPGYDLLRLRTRLSVGLSRIGDE
jgi:uncharacterized membrane protein YebE (DUF533 family)